MITVTKQELESLSRKALECAGLRSEDARAATQTLVSADLMGIGTHGVGRVPAYIERIRRGVLKARPNIEVTVETPSMAIIDGDSGLGAVVAQRGLEFALRLAGETGISYVGCRNSNHLGAIAPYLLLACKRRMISIAGTNAFPCIAPTGGRDVAIGNNPIGVGAPRRDHPPFLLDIAMSVVARSKIRNALERDESIPENWALDSLGHPTTNPLEALKGLVLPIGDHKGYGLASAVDILSGVLSGGRFATQVNSMFQQFDEPQHVAHFFIVLDPARLMGLETYYRQMESFCALIKKTKPFDPASPVLLPGEIEAQTSKERTATGIPLDEELYEILQGLAGGGKGGSIPNY